MNDLRFALRQLRKNPAFTIIAMLTLALGIGANTVVFSVVNAVLLRPLPYKDHNRLVMGWEANSEQGVDQNLVSAPNFLDWKDRSNSFEQIAAFRPSLSYNLTGGDAPARISVMRASASLFPLLGVQASIGRAFLPEEDTAGSDQVALLSYGLWQRHFGADPQIIGKKLTLHDTVRTIVGVMPPNFRFPFQPEEQSDVWIPLGLYRNENERSRGYHFLQVIGRLKPDISLEQAQAEMEAVTHQLQQQYPDTNAGWSARLVPLREQLFGKTPRALFLLQGVVAFVLLIACVNLANLLLARAEGRQKEIALRLALGASRFRIVRQLITESVLLATLGGALGLMLVSWGTGTFIRLLPTNLPRVEQVKIDANVLGITLAISLLTGLIFGLMPGLLSSNPRLNETLKEGRRTTGAGLSHRHLRNGLAVSQVALGLALLVGAALMINSFLRLQRVNPGFNQSHLLTMELYLPQYKYSEGHLATFYKQLLQRVETLPGVQSAGLVTSLPIGGRYAWIYGISIEGRQPLSFAAQPVARWRAVTPDYFRVMEIPLLAGRYFGDRDEAGAREVVIINEALAHRYFQNEDPIGQRLKIADRPWHVIVGVVGNVKSQAIAAESEPEMYVPYLQNPVNYLTLLVRSSSDPLSLVADVRSQVLAVDRDQPVFNVRSMEQVVSTSVSQPRFQALLMGGFAGLALFLAAVGVYGVISYSVSQRTHEIGIRIALGASRRDVLKLVMRQGMLIALLGVTAGLAATFALTRFLGSLLFGVSATDAATFATASLMLIGATLLASYLPARKATKVEPMIALRYE
jgi:putative ABC transport system permease protein